MDHAANTRIVTVLSEGGYVTEPAVRVSVDYTVPFQHKILRYRYGLMDSPDARSCERDVPADAGFLCDKATELRDVIKETTCITTFHQLKSLFSLVYDNDHVQCI
jgi:hypothetical protein